MSMIRLVLASALLLSFSVFSQTLSLKVIDTDFSKGRLQNIQTLKLNDAVKLHGHQCDGLVLGFIGLREALYQLYPDSIIDRTNNRIISRSSPCLTDMAIFLTGARYQYNTYFVSDSIKHLFIVQRIDTEKAYAVKLKPGILPSAIDSLGKLAVKGELDACGIDKLRKEEERFSDYLVNNKPDSYLIMEEVKNFIWKPVLRNSFIKTDILNKKLKTCAANSEKDK